MKWLLAFSLQLSGAMLFGAVVAGGWLYRDRLLAGGLRLPTGPDAVDSATIAPGNTREAPGGRAARATLARVEDKVDSLNGWRGDSVVLSRSEMTALVTSGLDPGFRRYVDSLRIDLGDGTLGVSGLVVTAALPPDALGPFAAVLGPRERVTARGPVEVLAPGLAGWTVLECTVHDWPMPRALVNRFVQRSLGGSETGTLRFRIPPGITAVRIRPTGVTLVGARGRR